MRVLLVNTSEHTGGASVAAGRLLEALNDNGVKAKYLVARKTSERPSVAALPSHWRYQAAFYAERLGIWMYNRFRRDHLFDIDPAWFGVGITRLPEFREADIVHLHWVNQGMLSLAGVRHILGTGRPVVWTLHDMWPFTGVCHYARECVKWRTGCHHCELLHAGGGPDDLSAVSFRRKADSYRTGRLSFVACSRWLAALAEESPLLAGRDIACIPNPLNTRRFRPGAKAAARQRLGIPQERRLILFAAYKVTSPLKGVDYLCEALRHAVAAHPGVCEQWQLVAVGREADRLDGRVPVPVTAVDYVGSEERMIDYYVAADVLALPSLYDNLPNIIAEAMACGVPCVGFDVGGIPQMIDHRVNGYLAAYRDSADFARGLFDTLHPDHYADRCAAARHKAETTYSETAVASRYLDVYQEMLSPRHGRPRA